MEQICPVCNNQKRNIIQDKQIFIWKCFNCGHVFTKLSKDKQEFYNEDYYLTKHKNWFANPDVKLFDFITKKIQEHFNKQPITLLDIGCGRGDFLKFCHSHINAMQLYGIDVSANQEDGIIFIKGDFNSYQFNRKFDVIVGGMVIEHIDDPNLFVQKIYDLLSSKGMVLLTTINNNSIIYHLARVLNKIGLCGPYKRLYDHHHLQHYAVNSLKRLMEKNGFKIILQKKYNFPLAAIDLPENNFLIRIIYKFAINIIFLISRLFRDGINQIIICKKIR